MALLDEITQQQILQAALEADTSSLLHWILILAEAAGCVDLTTGQVTSPGFAQLVHAHLPPGISRPPQIYEALQLLPASVLISFAHTLSCHACITTASWHHRPAPNPRPTQQTASWTGA